MSNNLIEIGQIVNTHGVKGHLKVVPWVDDVYDFDNMKHLYIGENKYLISEVKYHKNVILIKLKGVNTLNDALAFKNSILKIERDFFKLEEGRYFIVDLVGCKVVSEDGAIIGTLIEVFPTGSNDVYVVKDKDNHLKYIPAIKDVIISVDIENKIVVINLIEGLES